MAWAKMTQAVPGVRIRRSASVRVLALSSMAVGHSAWGDTEAAGDQEVVGMVPVLDHIWLNGGRNHGANPPPSPEKSPDVARRLSLVEANKRDLQAD
jgi:hypothetical protein